MIRQSKTFIDSGSHSPNEKMNSPEPEKKIRFAFIGFTLICSVAIAGMIYFAVLSLVGSHLGGLNGIMGLVSATFGWLFSIFTWSAAAGGMKILWRLRLPRYAAVFGIIGLFTGLILLGPMIAVPLLTPDTDTRFGEAFGSEWETQIPVSVLAHFQSNHLVAAEYFLPRPLDNCLVIKDVSLYNGSAGNEEGLKLFFDAYLPTSTDQSLPGANSTLIRIHGGGFSGGDKGTSNMPLMNRYFAAQGYCVFDIQYGLRNRNRILEIARVITPEYVMGNYSFNDMVRHIGLFCQYLTLHQAEYKANLHSVFVSGGSAGGHLTCITALAIASQNHTATFGSEITIKGYVPFYPATKLDSSIDGGVINREFYNAVFYGFHRQPTLLGLPWQSRWNSRTSSLPRPKRSICRQRKPFLHGNLFPVRWTRKRHQLLRLL